MKILLDSALILLTIAAAGGLGHYFVIFVLKAAKLMPESIDERQRRLSAWIGITERAIVALLTMFGSIGATAFVFATKAGVMSFRVENQTNKHHFTEYVLVGTMVSYLFGLLFGIVGMKVLEAVRCDGAICTYQAPSQPHSK